MKYTFYWLTGEREVLEGSSPEAALTQAGFGQGAMKALDFWVNGDNNNYVWNPKTRYWNITPEVRKRIFNK